MKGKIGGHHHCGNTLVIITWNHLGTPVVVEEKAFKIVLLHFLHRARPRHVPFDFSLEKFRPSSRPRGSKGVLSWMSHPPREYEGQLECQIFQKKIKSINYFKIQCVNWKNWTSVCVLRLFCVHWIDRCFQRNLSRYRPFFDHEKQNKTKKFGDQVHFWERAPSL